MKALSKQGIYQLPNGYYQAYFNGHCVAHCLQRYYCVEVLNMYKTGKLKI